MNGENPQKIKSLLTAVPQGALVDSKWMRRHEVADSLCYDYVQRGWLKRLAHGLFLRPSSEQVGEGEPIDWQVVLASMHQIMKMNFHVGGDTALRLHGLGHYVPMGGKERVSLFSDKLPGWLSRVETNARFDSHSLKLFDDDGLGVKPLSHEGASFGLPVSFPLSSPERAVLEALDELPDGTDFEHTDLIFQNLTNLRPQLLMKLLLSCRKVKVLRLFFVFAHRHEHAWLKHLDESRLDFGKGDRQLVKGGKVHPRYRITVPPDFLLSSKLALIREV